MAEPHRLAGLTTSDAVTLALVAVAVRGAVAAGAWFAGTGPVTIATPDGVSYLDLAEGLRATGGYGLAGPELFRPPAYPAVLAIVSAPASPLSSAIVLNIVLSVALTWIVALTAGRLGGRRPARVAGLAAALSPDLVMWSVSALAEIWLALAVAVSACALVMWTTESRPARASGWFLLAAAAMVVGAYAKIAAYPAALALPLLAVFDSRAPWRRRGGLALVGVVLVAVSIGAWHVRNGLVSGYWGYSTQFARAALFTVAAGVEAERSGAGYALARRDEARAVSASPFRAIGDEHRTGRMWSAAAQRVAESPGAALRVYGRGVLLSAVDPGAFRVFDLFSISTGSRPGWWTIARLAGEGRWSEARAHLAGLGGPRAVWPLALGVALAALWGLAVRGATSQRARPWRWVAVGGIAYFLLISGGPAASARFRVPIIPVLAVLAALGAVQPGARPPEEPVMDGLPPASP